MKVSVFARGVAALALAVCSSCERDPAPGALQVVSYPLGELYVDGHATRISTPTRNHPVPAGRHVVSLRREGVRFESQTVDVRSNHTSHLYFRAREPDTATDSSALCATGREDFCWARIDAAMRAGNRAEARTLGETYLGAHPDGGYSIVVRDLVNRLGGHAVAPDEDDPE